MRSSVVGLSRLLVLCCIAIPGIHAAEPSNSDLDRKFSQTVKPFLTSYCIGCHSGSAPAAQFDLAPYSSMAAVVRDYPHWNSVLEKLSAKQMPPKAMKQPADEVRQEVINWIEAVRTNEARKNAGDPGVVLAHRLSNSEYNYTIRDLTGVDLQPTREFPVDPANPAGFDNSGESLTMSPALLNKYLQAAREVANHMVLTPDGFDFSPTPMLVETDREKYAILRIINFYESQPTDYADYFQAAWRFKHRAELGKPGDTLAGIAADAKLSAKYLPAIWEILEGTDNEVGPVAKLRGMWRGLPAPPVSDQEQLRTKVVEMRDFVTRIRKHTAMQFAAPVVRGLPAGSQPLLNWKLLQFNLHRRNSDPKALRNDTDPPPVAPTIPRYAGLHQEGAPRWAALMEKDRIDDTDLVVPAAERSRYEAAFERLASVFPDVFYVKERGRFFPDDSQDKGRLLSAGYHNVMGYWRDDTPLMELILDENGQKKLDRLWDEFDFISDHTHSTWVQFYFNQSGEVLGKGAESGFERPSDKNVSTPDIIFKLRDLYLAKAEASNNPEAVKAINHHFERVNDTLRRMEKMRVDAEPRHVEALVSFAERAYRRPLSQEEREKTAAFYHTLREKGGLSHEEAIRDSIVSVLMSPKFCYRIEQSATPTATKSVAPKATVAPAKLAKTAPAATAGQPLPSSALASRLSYFLWASMPDQELAAHAKAGDLQKPEVITAQARRMMKDPRANGLAVEFTGNWLEFRQFQQHNAVDRERFPSFDNDLREAMFEEPVRFMENLIRNDGSILDLLYGNYTFVNPVLAKHYGMPEVPGKPDHWVRVDDAQKYGRGGILPMAVFLTQNAPGLRTSPVKRGHWLVSRVLGEVIPAPPPNVPELPQDESRFQLPLREMLAKHRDNPACASCHQRFDAYGLVFEGYGPIGEKRANDLAGHPVDARAAFPGGSQGSGVEAVQAYIREHRQNEFIDNVSRKLLAYALGRSLMISDEPTILQMRNVAIANGYRFAPLVETVVTSPQFLNRRRIEIPQQKGE
jgi:hypothetical protein